MNLKTFFIIGPNGIGKTTTFNLLKKILHSDNYSIHDFDERGVPDNADDVWRKSETKYWISVGNKNKECNKNTIICGFAKPEEIESISTELMVILLDGNKETISNRISSRYSTNESILELERATGKSVNKFIADNICYSNILREKCIEYNYKIVSVDNKKPEAVSSEVLKIIKSN